MHARQRVAVYRGGYSVRSAAAMPGFLALPAQKPPAGTISSICRLLFEHARWTVAPCCPSAMTTCSLSSYRTYWLP
eukprot:93917-Pleurochrysis_carterae.AAC.1